MNGIVDNLRTIHQRIDGALARCDRHHGDAKLMLATKMQTVQTLRYTVGLGEHLFGENKVQELVPKVTELYDLPITWHFIGHLQTNKVKDVVGRAVCVQSVDRPSLVEALQKECAKRDVHIDVMLEVNTSFEDSKHGSHPNDVARLVDVIAECPLLRVTGYMTIGANVDDERTVRKGFDMLRAIRDRYLPVMPAAKELSMGMSHDLEWAIAEGSTIVRVGTAIFGARSATKESCNA